jgi:hypothetical protein
MKIILKPEDVVKISKHKVDECFDMFKVPLNLMEASSLIKILTPRLENIISNTLEEAIYDELMDKNEGFEWLDDVLSDFKNKNT